MWLLDTATGKGEQFPEALLPNSYWGDVAWSPDGKLVAIQNIRGDTDDLLLYDLGSQTTSRFKPFLASGRDTPLLST